MKTKFFKHSAILLTCSLLLVMSYMLRAEDPPKSCTEQQIEVLEVSQTNAVVIFADIPTSAIGQKMGELYKDLFLFMQSNNIQPVGPPFAVYYTYDPNGNTTFETGFPVSGTVEGNEKVSYKEFPAMKVVSTLYIGAYENMAPVYEKIQGYLTENKLEWSGVAWETYLTNPEEVKDQNENQTLIYFPVLDKK